LSKTDSFRRVIAKKKKNGQNRLGEDKFRLQWSESLVQVHAEFP